MSEDRIDHRKIYAKGYFDGLSASGNTMKPHRFQENLKNQSSIAKKVFEVVPIQEAWTSGQIANALSRTTKSTIDFRIFQGCLNTLKDSGLVLERNNGHFQRVEVREKKEIILVKTNPSVAISNDELKGTPIEILSEISSRLKRIINDIHKIASDIETAALVIEENQTENNQNLDKLKQLQSILKSMS